MNTLFWNIREHAGLEYPSSADSGSLEEKGEGSLRGGSEGGGGGRVDRGGGGGGGERGGGGTEEALKTLICAEHPSRVSIITIS